MRWAAFLMLSGCSSILGIDDFKLTDAGTTGGEEVMPDASGYCLGPTGFRVCLMAEPTNAPVNITTTVTIDTVSSPLCAPTQPMSWKMSNQPDACFIIAPSVTFNAPTIRAVGARPLVVFASDTITISTHVDVASHINQMRGAGSPATACTPPMAAGNNANSAPGGGGGSFMSKGGDGGAGSSGGTQIIGRGAPADANTPTILRAGCAGGIGGNSNQQGGQPGNGGGAIYLVAGNRIALNGFINASGSPGIGGSVTAGGGGGGSGGMIMLHAPMLSSNGGVLIANGGGAGGGGGTSAPGATGTEPNPSTPNTSAAGGNGGGPGGAGYSGPTQATNGGNGSPVSANGGGGGGGGGGYIRANMTAAQITASPGITVVP